MKQEKIQQIGALPIVFAEDGSARIVLVTSRDTRRWVIPKGWPMKGLKAHQAAAQEAREEAGLVGNIGKKPIGRYSYMKRREDSADLCQVDVFLLEVVERLVSWREQDQREVGTFTPEEASTLVAEVGLQDIIRGLKPGKLKR